MNVYNSVAPFRFRQGSVCTLYRGSIGLQNSTESSISAFVWTWSVKSEFDCLRKMLFDSFSNWAFFASQSWSCLQVSGPFFNLSVKESFVLTVRVLGMNPSSASLQCLASFRVLFRFGELLSKCVIRICGNCRAIFLVGSCLLLRGRRFFNFFRLIFARSNGTWCRDHKPPLITHPQRQNNYNSLTLMKTMTAQSHY